MADDLTSRIAHLYRRAAFGARPAELESARSQGYEGAVNALLFPQGADATAVPPPALDPATLSTPEGFEARQALNKLRNQQEADLVEWWVEQMTMSSFGAKEKLTLFWHDHFATSANKVNNPQLMLTQNQLFRERGMGGFEELAQAVAKDGAMMIWLDSNKNNKGKPNENFARELMELFTIGIGSYTDADVREAARAFTGWRHNRNSNGFNLVARQHDNGVKTVLGKTGNLSGEEVVTLLCRNPAAAKFVTAKLWRQYAFPVGVDHPVVGELSAGFAADLDITKLMRSILLHPQFTSAEARRGVVKQPIEWVVGAMRQLGLRPSQLAPKMRMRPILRSLSQEPFFPPSVGGWPDNGYWISTQSALARYRFALQLARAARLDWFSGYDSAGRLDALARQFGIDGWTSNTASTITRAGAPVQQLAAALVSPEYVLN
jgi:uncharacterized protein (DUF1800 family)